MKEDELRKLPIWTWYIDGARTMLRLLRENGLCDEPLPKGKPKEGVLYHKAILDLLSDNINSVERFLCQDYDSIGFTDFVKDKKGKFIKCRAYFAKLLPTFREI